MVIRGAWCQSGRDQKESRHQWKSRAGYRCKVKDTVRVTTPAKACRPACGAISAIQDVHIMADKGCAHCCSIRTARIRPSMKRLREL